MSLAAVLQRFPTHLQWRQELPPDALPTGIAEVDALLHGCPRGRITEILGPASSGRTSVLQSLLAASTGRGEVCALIDSTDAFDPVSAAAAGVDLARLVWVRCAGDVENAMRAADLVLHGGGFGVIALDLCEADPKETRRIPASYWFRFQRVVEKTPSVLAVLARESHAKSSSALTIEMRRKQAAFRGQAPYQLLLGVDYEAAPRKPMHRPAGFAVRGSWVVGNVGNKAVGR